MSYEVMVSAHASGVLAGRVGQSVTFQTIQYLEQQAQGASFVPRLVGFVSPEDRRLFDLLTKVKGLGVKRALRAMAAPSGEIAAAIAAGDVGALKALPEIGKKLAETIVLELREKVAELAFTAGEPGVGAGRQGAKGGAGDGGINSPQAQLTITALMQLGDDREGAAGRVRRALADGGEAARMWTADQLLAAVFSLRS